MESRNCKLRPYVLNLSSPPPPCCMLAPPPELFIQLSPLLFLLLFLKQQYEWCQLLEKSLFILYTRCQSLFVQKDDMHSLKKLSIPNKKNSAIKDKFKINNKIRKRRCDKPALYFICFNTMTLIRQLEFQVLHISFCEKKVNLPVGQDYLKKKL